MAAPGMSLLQKCLSGEEEGITLSVNCGKFACCGGTIHEEIIESDNDKHTKIDEPRTETARNILQSKSSGRSKRRSCFSCCCKGSTETDQEMATKTENIHSSSSRAKDISDA